MKWYLSSKDDEEAPVEHISTEVEFRLYDVELQKMTSKLTGRLYVELPTMKIYYRMKVTLTLLYREGKNWTKTLLILALK